MLDDKERAALFLELHREIELTAHRAAEVLAGLKAPGDVLYPPNGGLTDRELAGFGRGGADAVAAYRKIVADAMAGPIHRLLCLIHDVFYDTYWLWRDRRPDPGWALDTFEGTPENEPPRGAGQQ